MTSIWRFEPVEDGTAGILYKKELGTERQTITLQSVGPGHCIDIGRKIADLFNMHDSNGSYPTGCTGVAIIQDITDIFNQINDDV